MNTKKSSMNAGILIILITSVVLLGIGSFIIVNEIINRNNESNETSN